MNALINYNGIEHNVSIINDTFYLNLCNFNKVR